MILDVASKMFARYSFHKTTIEEIARASRKAKGTVYYHFTDKEDLFKAVITQEIQTVKNGLLEILNNPDLIPPVKVKAYLLKRLELLSHAVNYQSTLATEFIEQYEFVEDVRQDYHRWEGTNIKKMISVGIEQNYFGKTDNLDVLIDVFVLVLKVLEGPLLEQDKYQALIPHFDSMMNIMIRGISKS